MSSKIPVKIQTGLRVDETIYNELKTLAQQEGRSLNNLIEHIIQQYLSSLSSFPKGGDIVENVVNYVRMYRTSDVKEYNRMVDAGWRYITFDKVADRDELTTVFVLGWAAESGEPVYPPNPDIHYMH